MLCSAGTLVQNRDKESESVRRAIRIFESIEHSYI